MLITRTSIFSGISRTLDLPVTEGQLLAHENGALLQDAFPNLTAEEREFCKTGMTAEEWNQLFSEQKIRIAPENPEDKIAGDLDGIPIPTQPEYRPPSPRIYQTIGVRGYKFHKIRPVLKYLNQNIYLAGGSLRTLLKCSGEQVSDFDLFFRTFEEVQKLRDKLTIDDWEQTYECPLGFLYTYKKGNHKLQLICETEYSSANLLVSSFDVSACMCCWHDGVLTFTREFVRSVKTKKLRVCNVSFPVATLNRLIKYSHKGYNCSMASEDFCRLISGKTFDNSFFRHYID